MTKTHCDFCDDVTENPIRMKLPMFDREYAMNSKGAKLAVFTTGISQKDCDLCPRCCEKLTVIIDSMRYEKD